MKKYDDLDWPKWRRYFDLPGVELDSGFEYQPRGLVPESEMSDEARARVLAKMDSVADAQNWPESVNDLTSRQDQDTNDVLRAEIVKLKKELDERPQFLTIDINHNLQPLYDDRISSVMAAAMVPTLEPEIKIEVRWKNYKINGILRDVEMSAL